MASGAIKKIPIVIFKKLHTSSVLTKDFVSGKTTVPCSDLSNYDIQSEKILSLVVSAQGQFGMIANLNFNDAGVDVFLNTNSNVNGLHFQLFGIVVQK